MNMNKAAIAFVVLLVAGAAAVWFSADRNPAPENSPAPPPSLETTTDAGTSAAEPAQAPPEPTPAGAIQGSVSGRGPKDIAYVSVAKGAVTIPDPVTAAWLKANGERVILKTELTDSDTFAFDAVPAGNYTVIVAVMNRENPPPPAEWRTAAVAAKVADQATVAIELTVP